MPAASPCSATRSTTSSTVRHDAAPGPHLVREHGAGLLPAGGGGRRDHRRADRAEPQAARRRARRGADPVHRVRPQCRQAAAAAAPLRLLRRRRGLDPARLAPPARAGAHRRGDSRERDVRGADEGAAAGRRARAAGGGGRREAPHRRRGAAQRVRGPDASSRPRASLARAHRACRWCSRSGRPASPSPLP